MAWYDEIVDTTKGNVQGLVSALRNPVDTTKQFLKGGEKNRKIAAALLQGDTVPLKQAFAEMTPEQLQNAMVNAGIGFAGTINKPYFTESALEGYGKVISSPYGKISILSNNPHSPKTHSITSFFVDEASRNKGYGKELIDEALRMYPSDIGAQVSSIPSAKAFYNKGFRLASDKNAPIDEILKEIENSSSAYLVK